ncbi:MAG: adenylyltransferase/cytidyltransferase family protein [Chlamydiota bacterium]
MNRYQEEYASKKIIAPYELEKRLGYIRKAESGDKTIATLNGSFDLLHAGHLHIIYEASQAADALIVALNSDDSIKENKGPQRPIIPLKYRLQMMAALAFVDYVTWFEESDPRELLRVIKPNVHVNGSEYGDKCIEAEIIRKYGGEIKIASLIPGLSTSEIINRIKDLCAS